MLFKFFDQLLWMEFENNRSTELESQNKNVLPKNMQNKRSYDQLVSANVNSKLKQAPQSVVNWQNPAHFVIYSTNELVIMRLKKQQTTRECQHMFMYVGMWKWTWKEYKQAMCCYTHDSVFLCVTHQFIILII